MPGKASSSFSDAMLILMRARFGAEYEYLEISEWFDVVIERLAHAAVDRRTMLNSNA